MHYASTLKIITRSLFLISTTLVFSYYAGLYRWLDINLLKERAKDLTGEHVFNEDWSSISSINGDFDYSWLSDSTAPILIAHALGASGTQNQNKLPEMKKSLALGIKLMEVDLWLDQNKEVRCHHGPDLPLPIQSSDCTFEKALKFASENDVRLILDIKTDFELTGQDILRRVSNRDSGRIIFQLYKPLHAHLFEKWHNEKPLAGPIITTYLARRSIAHIQRRMLASKFKVLTIPSQRLPAIDPNNKEGLIIFSHPTHACEDFLNQRAYNAIGFYVTSDVASRIQANCPR